MKSNVGCNLDVPTDLGFLADTQWAVAGEIMVRSCIDEFRSLSLEPLLDLLLTIEGK